MSQHIKPTPVKHCAYCGQQLERKRFNGTLESLSIFNRRQYCDLQCAGMAQRKADASPSAFRKQARKYRNDHCETCGSSDMLGCHHIDEDVTNNEPSNVQTLCAACHTRLHWQTGKLIPRQHYECVICGLRPGRLHRGMCEKHYQRWKKYGDPFLTKVRRGSQYVLVTARD